MIDFHTYCEIRELYDQHISMRQIAKRLSLARRTVSKWATSDRYEPYKKGATPSILDPYKPAIRRQLELTQCSARSVFRSLKEQGYKGGVTIVNQYVATITSKASEESSILPSRWMLMLLQGKVTVSQLLQQAPGRLSEGDAGILIARIREGKLSQRNRALAVLADLKGLSVPQIVRFLMIKDDTVRDYLARYREDGLNGLFSFRSNKPTKHLQAEFKEALFAILHSPPRDYGINRTSWRIPDLHRVMKEQGLPINKDGIGAIIKGAGFHMRKAKKVLTSKDPDYRKKLEAIKAILANLTSSEKFFSIDEYGPFAIRTQGGTALTGPGQERTIPQWQKSKGSLTLVGALELSTNQVSHFYSDRKSTDEMIRMLHMLLRKYRDQERLYLSWDAASWHSSRRFEREIEIVNSDDFRSVNGAPLVSLAPLPSCAQFLNVIESVFSGMARAIIHNSDYQSVTECKEAIDRYLLERNEFFQAYPKRAGKKIWGQEREVPIFSESNNCKDPQYR